MTAASSGQDPAWLEQELEDLLERFEVDWQESADPPDLGQFLDEVCPQQEGSRSSDSGVEATKANVAESSQSSVPRRRVVAELVKIDLEYRWRRYAQSGESSGDPPRLEDYISRFPDLKPTPELAGEEYFARHRWGDKPSHEEYQERFELPADAVERCLTKIDEMLAKSSAAASVKEDTAESGEAAETEETSSAQKKAGDQTVREASVEQHPVKPRLVSKRPPPKTLGRYEVRSVLGEGSFGVVYLAYDPKLDREVAIKAPHRHRLRRKQHLQQFLQEAQLAAKIRHPVLVDVYDVHHDAKECFLVMEYIDGQPLQEKLTAGPMDFRSAAILIAQVADAIHQGHTKGLYHCDLKPANILLDARGQPHVTDFGLAIREEEQRSRGGEISGTPVYMAPEQVRGESHRLDGRTDLWSLGVIFYQMLTGRRPFDGKSVDQIFDEITRREPKPPRQINDSIPAALEAICLKCLAKDVTRRYTIGKDLAEDLRRWIEAQEAAELRSGLFRDIGPEDTGGAASIRMKPKQGPVLASGATTNLPRPSNQFIGREKELSEMLKIMEDEDTSVVTITGPGGVGKTRFALRLGRALLERFEGGCWWTDLQTAHTNEAVAHAVLETFGVPAVGSDSSEEIVASVLELRRPLVLIIDNFEQAVSCAHETLGLWRDRAPHVKFVVTSRSLLGLSGEKQYELAPLGAPPESSAISAEACGEYDAVRLFVQRATEADSNFELTDHNAADVAVICRKLDGIPLAVELSAARVKILKPAQMVKKLGRKFELLKSTRRDLSDRQRTLNGAIEWSYDLLTPGERHAFLQASALPGGFFLEAAEEIIELDEFPDAPFAFDVVQSLREKSLLRSEDEGYEWRFRMYQSIRDYGEQKRKSLFSPEAEQALWRRVAGHFIAYGEQWRKQIDTTSGPEALDRISLETENLFAVQDWALAAGEPDLAARAILALAQTLAARGPADQRIPRLERSLAGVSAPLEASLLTALSAARQTIGDWDRAAECADEAVAKSRSLGDTEEAIAALLQQGQMRRIRDDVDGAMECFQTCEEACRRVNDQRQLAAAICHQAFGAWRHGDLDEALRRYQEADKIARRLGDEGAMAAISRHHGHILTQRGELDEAMTRFVQAEQAARRRGDRHAVHLALTSQGIAHAEQGHYDLALSCYDQAEQIATELGEKRSVAVNEGNRGLAYADQGRYEDALACFAAAEAINSNIGSLSGVALNIGNRGAALGAMGRIQEALKCLGDAQRLNRQIENPIQEAINVGERGIVLMKQGRQEESEQALRQALKVFDDAGASATAEYFNFQTALAVVCRRSGNAEEAQSLTDAATHLAESLGFTDAHPRLRIRESLAMLREEL